jgi:hypothetical protein
VRNLPLVFLKSIARRPDGMWSVLCADEGPQVDPRPYATTVERTFDDELRTVLGNGRFLCKKTKYIKGGYPTFEILVPGHSRVLFHRGNKELDSEGCVCIGENFAFVDGVTAVGDSRGGFAEFWSLVKDLDEFELVVTGR